MHIPAMNYTEIIFGFILFNYSTYLPEIILSFLQLFGVKAYVLTGDKEKYKGVVKKLEKHTFSSSYILRNGKSIPSGYFIGKGCIGLYVNESRYAEEERVRIIMTESFYKMLLSEDEVEFSKIYRYFP